MQAAGAVSCVVLLTCSICLAAAKTGECAACVMAGATLLRHSPWCCMKGVHRMLLARACAHCTKPPVPCTHAPVFESAEPLRGAPTAAPAPVGTCRICREAVMTTNSRLQFCCWSGSTAAEHLLLLDPIPTLGTAILLSEGCDTAAP